MLHDGPSWINGVPIKTAFGFVLPVDVVVALTYFPVKNMLDWVPGNPFQPFYSHAIFWRRHRYQYAKDEKAFHSMIVNAGSGAKAYLRLRLGRRDLSNPDELNYLYLEIAIDESKSGIHLLRVGRGYLALASGTRSSCLNTESTVHACSMLRLVNHRVSRFVRVPDDLEKASDN